MRSKLLARNTISSLVFQISTIVCGFILPRAIIVGFGSEINGLVNSISQFLSLIALLEMGVGAVVKSALYGPLARKDNKRISEIVTSAGKFFRIVGICLFIYVIALMIVYPAVVTQSLGSLSTALLIAAISISFFGQYYFGVVDRLLLTADQHGYIQYNTQTITLILNTIVCVILIELGYSIHIVKLSTSLIYLTRPIVQRLYINKHYQINRKIKYEGEPIEQKWNGVAQHVAAVILTDTDTIVLTLLASLHDVSIYSVYHLVVGNIEKLFVSATNGIEAVLGELWAKKKTDELRTFFSRTEWILHVSVTLVYGCTGSLILPFVKIYTRGVSDVNYNLPLFAFLIVLANAAYCYRIPYHLMIKAGGCYKETQHSFIISAAMNLIVSVLLVHWLGLIGVAIGTLAAMSYQTVWMALFLSKNLFNWPLCHFIRQLFVDILTVVIGMLIFYLLHFDPTNFLEWFLDALITVPVWIAVSIAVNLLFNKRMVLGLMKKLSIKLNRSIP